MLDFGRCNLKHLLPRRIRFLIFILLLLFSIIANPLFWNFRQEIATGFGFDTIFTITSEGIYQLNTRRSYYPNQLLGKIFENKLTFYLDKYRKNFFQGLDLNYYFFANHPRERTGMTEKEIFFWFWLPVFLVGFLSSLRKSFLITNLIFLGSLSIVSFFVKIDNFILLLSPFWAVNFYVGLKQIFME